MPVHGGKVSVNCRTVSVLSVNAVSEQVSVNYQIVSGAI